MVIIFVIYKGSYFLYLKVKCGEILSFIYIFLSFIWKGDPQKFFNDQKLQKVEKPRFTLCTEMPLPLSGRHLHAQLMTGDMKAPTRLPNI